MKSSVAARVGIGLAAGAGICIAGYILYKKFSRTPEEEFVQRKRSLSAAEAVAERRWSKHILRFLVHDVLTSATAPFPPEFVESLLFEEDDALEGDGGCKLDQPFYIHLADYLFLWGRNLRNPPEHREVVGWPNTPEDDAIYAKLKTLTPSLITFYNSVISQTNDFGETDVIQRTHLVYLLRQMGLEGVRFALGLRCTAGTTKDVLPPSRNTLMKAFNQLHSPGHSKLTVGARALTKHNHRSSEGWWGEANGSEEEKNQAAEKVAKRILDDASWINLHHLPHDVVVLEVRSREGYGARWLADGSEFRGFLEPHSTDGHEKKWRH